MELGSEESHSSTFCFNGEDHTLGNSLRFLLNKDPRVVFCGYSVPHPSENKVNVRVQTTGAPGKEVFKDALLDMVAICEHVSTTMDSAVGRFKANEQRPEVSTRTATHASGLTHRSGN
ncbi:DNA-directed RNA polymerases I and III subunit RPAC2 [Selaginella moellendorffii]|nr:DNA-directed RNA polymerases I and III subunit RPAC2 [Selaginella moellendorffii]|eukprot:XP_002983787.2 DNA-directed RNA polymerases I and III subunit RPAC2 [Selaginella moellendorffii]